jgi:hypothetical protein
MSTDTIDPANFEPQGKPSREQARNVWDSMPNASARTVADRLTGMGYDISWRTVARWHASAWREAMPSGVPLAEKGGVRGVNKAVREELKKLDAPKPPKPPKEAPKEQRITAGLEAAVAGPPPHIEELMLIEQRRAELMSKSEAQLDQIAAKARMVYNILLMEQAARRSHVMVLIPKETAALVESLTEASKIGLSGNDGQPPRLDDPRVIDGSVIREAAPPNETADAIRKFRQAQAA